MGLQAIQKALAERLAELGYDLEDGKVTEEGYEAQAALIEQKQLALEKKAKETIAPIEH